MSKGFDPRCRELADIFLPEGSTKEQRAERRYHFATQKLIDLKWHLANMEFQAPANSLLRTEIHTQIEVAQRAIDALLSDNFPNETDASTDERFVRVVE